MSLNRKNISTAQAHPCATDPALIGTMLSLSPTLRLEYNDGLRRFAVSVWRSLMGVSNSKSTFDALKLLHDTGVEFVIIGGIAATLHGCPRVAFDIDICAPLTDENLAKIWNAAAALLSGPQTASAQNCLGLSDGKERFEGLPNLHVITDAGPLDVLSSVPGVGAFADCLSHSKQVDFAGWNCRILGSDALIKSKITAGRPKDHLVVTDMLLIDQMQMSHL